MVVLKGGCAFWVLEIGAIARASHLLHWEVFIVLIFVSVLVACASHFALFLVCLSF